MPPADIVTLDRVINVYSDWQRLVEVSAEHAQRLYGLVYPRDRVILRLVIFTMNLALSVFRKPVRASVRSEDEIDRLMREKGLSRRSSRSVGPVWQVAVYDRPQTAT